VEPSRHQVQRLVGAASCRHKGLRSRGRGAPARGGGEPDASGFASCSSPDARSGSHQQASMAASRVSLHTAPGAVTHLSAAPWCA
jgi:hypothetical protein